MGEAKNGPDRRLMPAGPMSRQEIRTETKGERKRTTMAKQNNRNSSYLVEEVTPQILSLGTKTVCYFYGCVI